MSRRGRGPAGQRRGRSEQLVVVLACLSSGALLGACGGQKVIGTSSRTTSASAISATIDVRHIKGIGRVLVTASGRALYLLTADPRGGSGCYGPCAQVWPPLVLKSGAPKAGPGVDARMLATFQDHQGQQQVEYDKHALYTYIYDTGPGQATGEGVATYGGGWWLVSPSGREVKRGKLH